MSQGEAPLVRISTERLAEHRRLRRSRILLTGATGFLGSHIAAWLLRSGYRLTVLARSSPNAGATERFARIMHWHGIPDSDRTPVRLTIVEGDIRSATLGLDPHLTKFDEIIHCAAETSFAARRRAEIEEVNVRGIERLLDLAVAGRCSAFHYLSTAFVAGRSTGRRPEALSDAAEYHNPYEETKCLAERMMWRRCRENGIRPFIYRPSIVYGNSVTGRSLLFNAVYHPVRSALFLRGVYLKDIHDAGGRRAAAAGVRLDADDLTLHLPLRVHAGGPGIDLVPVDFFTDAFVALFQAALDGGIFHIANGHPTPISTIVSFTNRLFHLTGVEAVAPDRWNGTPRTSLEAAFERMIEVYRPYLSHQVSFGNERSGPLLARAGLSCPQFTYDVFERCMTYAVACGWRPENGAPEAVP